MDNKDKSGAATQASIPAGWKLVPIEPTEDMVTHGFESRPDPFFSTPEVWAEYDAMTGCQQAAHRAKLCYSAMLAAAPSPVAALPSQAEPVIRDGIWWPAAYCRDPNGNIVPPAGKYADFKFGYDIGYADGLVAHRDSVTAIEKRIRAEILEQAAKVADGFYDHIRQYTTDVPAIGSAIRALKGQRPASQEGGDRG